MPSVFIPATRPGCTVSLNRSRASAPPSAPGDVAFVETAQNAPPERRSGARHARSLESCRNASSDAKRNAPHLRTVSNSHQRTSPPRVHGSAKPRSIIPPPGRRFNRQVAAPGRPPAPPNWLCYFRPPSFSAQEQHKLALFSATRRRRGRDLSSFSPRWTPRTQRIGCSVGLAPPVDLVARGCLVVILTLAHLLYKYPTRPQQGVNANPRLNATTIALAREDQGNTSKNDVPSGGRQAVAAPVRR